MANRKSGSGGQSQGPKQVGGGGASRSPNPQATNKPRSVATAHPQTTRGASSKPPTSSGLAAAPSRPPQPHPTAHRPSNGTKHQNAGNGAPKSQGPNAGSNFVKQTQNRSATNQVTPKRNGSGQNNGAQKAQGHSPQPTKNEAPKPKHSPAFFGGHTPASNLARPSPPRPENVQHGHAVKAHGASISGNKGFQGPSPMSKQTRSGHAQPHAQKAQKHVQPPTPAKGPPFVSASPVHRQQSENSSSTTFAKVEVRPMQPTQHPSRSGALGQSRSYAPLPTQGFEKPSHKIHQEHRAPPRSRPVQETSSKGHKNTPTKTPMNNRGQGQSPAQSMQPKDLSSIFSTQSKDSVNSSKKSHHAQQYRAKAPDHKSQAPNSIKADGSRSKIRRVLGFSFIPHDRLRKKPILSTTGAKNGLQNLRSRLNNSDTLASSATPPKKEQVSTRHNMPARSDSGGPPRYSLHVLGKPKTAKTSTAALNHAADRSQMSRKPQPAAGHRLKQFQVQSSSSKVLSQRDIKKKAPVRKSLLRQRTPTLTWRKSDTPRTSSAYSTLTAVPLPLPPKSELQNKVARKTISQNRDLFEVVSPIKVDVVKKYVKDHPNQPFVKSVCRALKKGFWPWADTSLVPNFPTTYDGSRRGSRITSGDKAKFIRQQRKDEMKLKRWSKPFGRKLLPGMHSAPIHVVPKSTPGKFRLIVDQSCGPHSLNSTIPKSQVKVQLDNIHDLGNQLLAVRKKYPKRKIILFKSDVQSAYRQVPMHPFWQIKQAVPVDGQYHIDRCNTFGNRGGGWNWDSVSSLVNWIATKKKGVSGLLTYVDDSFGWEFARNKKFYKPYNKHLPTKQAQLLELWDELGIPHDEDKQLYGPSLPILGYQVNANAMSVKIPKEKKAKVVKVLRSYAHAGKTYTINELQSVAGSVSSSLSLYPRLRPGLRVLFDEMAVQEGGTTKLKVTKPVARSLSSLADFLEHAPPVPIRYQKEKVCRIGARTK